jgi:hypothetical protein
VITFNGIGVAVDRRFGARVALAAGFVLLVAGFGVLALLSPGDGYGTLERRANQVTAGDRCRRGYLPSARDLSSPRHREFSA